MIGQIRTNELEDQPIAILTRTNLLRALSHGSASKSINTDPAPFDCHCSPLLTHSPEKKESPSHATVTRCDSAIITSVLPFSHSLFSFFTSLSAFLLPYSARRCMHYQDHCAVTGHWSTNLPFVFVSFIACFLCSSLFILTMA